MWILFLNLCYNVELMFDCKFVLVNINKIDKESYIKGFVVSGKSIYNN